MRKILIFKGIIYLLELPEEPRYYSSEDYDDKSVSEEYKENMDRQLAMGYQQAKAAAIAEAKKNGEFEDQEGIEELLGEQCREFKKDNSSYGASIYIKDGIYDLPEGLETERVWQAREKNKEDWVDAWDVGETPKFKSDGKLEYRQIVRITKQKQ